jgi:hypothetical protein
MPFGPQICFDANKEGGSGETAEQKAAREAKETADKAAAEKAAKEAADKVEADRKAAVEAALKDAEKEFGRKLSDKEAEFLKEIMAKKTKLGETEKALEEANAKLKAFDGVDPAKFAELAKAAEEAEKAKREAEKAALEKAGDFDRVKKMMGEEHDKELAAEREKGTKIQTQLDVALKTIDDLTVGSAFANSQFIAEQTVLTGDIARATFGNYFEVEGGRVIGYDKPKGQEGRTKLVDSRGNALGFEDVMKRLVDARSDKDKLIRSTMKPGTGVTTKKGETEGHRMTEVPAGGGRSRIEAALASRKPA